MKSTLHLTNKTILLTGASRGIGVEIAKTLAAQGATLIGVARNPAALAETGRLVRAAGGQWHGIVWDVADLPSLPELVAETGPVDILINNAGLEIYRSFANYQLSEIQAVITTNLLAAMELTRLLLPAMQVHQQGQIINIASLAAKKGHPYDSIYSASKAGLWAWSDALRQELYQSGVNVSVLCPGYISEVGMMADTGIPAPTLAGSASPQAVADAVLRIIQQPVPEVIVSKDWPSLVVTRILLALWQLFPGWGDQIYRWIGVTATNRQRVKATAPASRITLEVSV